MMRLCMIIALLGVRPTLADSLPSSVSIPSLDPRNEVRLSATAGGGWLDNGYCSVCFAFGATLELGGRYSITDAFELFAEWPLTTAYTQLGNPRAGVRARLRGDAWALGATFALWAPVAEEGDGARSARRLLTTLGVRDTNAFIPTAGARVSGIARWLPTRRSFVHAEVGLAFLADDRFIETRIQAQNLDAAVSIGGFLNECWSLTGEVRVTYVPNHVTELPGSMGAFTTIEDDLLVAAGFVFERTRHEGKVWRIRSHVGAYIIGIGLDVDFDI
jgi:hypothetical protein